MGGVYHLDFRNALILTDDKWKVEAGGLPLHSFLLATVMPLGRTGDPEDEEVLLLRVDDTCQLPRQAELLEAREIAMWQRLTGGNLPADGPTQQEMQRSGLKCRILGTFYQTNLANGQSFLDFGADIDTIYAASRYRVSKPSPNALAIVASYPQITEDELRSGTRPHLLGIGSVRYSSTRRRAREHGEHQVPVQVRVSDFVGAKTGVFGMSRMGKSNTMKTLAVATYRHSKRIGEPIGQLLFDPQGEYATLNSHDDNTALAQLGSDVAVYRFGAREFEADTQPLQINFYDPAQIESAQHIIGSILSGVAFGEYISNFIGADLADPQPDTDGRVNFSRQGRAARARFCFYALLGKAGFAAQPNQRFSTRMKRDLVDAFNNSDSGFTLTTTGNRGFVYVEGTEAAQAVVDWLMDARDAGSADASDWLKDQSVNAIIALYSPTGNRLGWRWLAKLKPFHSHYATGDYAERICSDLVAGRLVIVDLSRGPEQVLQLLPERIINYLLAQAGDQFTSSRELHRIQIVIEEAHRLFDRKAYDAVSPNPYVRLAKEATKLRIGLIYATQEVASVAPAVLADTSNWIVAHLNNSDEIRALSKYYDFKSFELDILSAEDRGFARLKMRSGKYIVPVQILEFDHNMLNSARADAGLPRWAL